MEYGSSVVKEQITKFRFARPRSPGREGKERKRGRGGQESVNPNKPFTRALRAVGVPGNGANDMPEIAGPEWNLSGILQRFRRIRNSEDGF